MIDSENKRIAMTMPGDKVSIGKKTRASARSDWLVPAALLTLTFIPVAAGISRLYGLAGGVQVTPENARFFAMPLPVVIHILGASLFCILGAFQFAGGFRRRNPAWHRVVGRLLIPCGIAAALSGMWMSRFYPLAPHIQGDLLYGFRIFIGSAMVLFLVLGLVAVLRRDIARHRAWILRGYAIGQGAGTQALISILWMVVLGTPSELNRDLLLIAGWIINLVVAEWIIRGRPLPWSMHRNRRKTKGFSMPAQIKQGTILDKN